MENKETNPIARDLEQRQAPGFGTDHITNPAVSAIPEQSPSFLKSTVTSVPDAINLLAKDARERDKNMELARVIHVPTIQVSDSDESTNLCPEVIPVQTENFLNPEIIDLNEATKIDVITPTTHKHYESLKGLFGNAITDALTSGKALYDRKLAVMDNKGVGQDRRILGYDVWRNTLHPTMQQHYNCSQCRATWDVIFSIAVQETDGTVTYPAVKVLEAALEARDPVIENLYRNSPDGIEGFKDYFKLAAVPVPNELFPLFRVNQEMQSGADKAGWEHFHLADLGVLMDYNENRSHFGDVEYTDNLFKRLIDKRFNGEAFAKLCETIRKEILEKQKETFSSVDGSALMRYPDLIQLIKEIQLYHKVSGTGLVYLHERLGRASSGYLRHLNSSVLGNAFDAYFDLLDNPNDFDAIMAKVVGILRRAVDSANYKNKVAEAKPATLEQAYNFLQAEGLQSTLLRRLIDLDEVSDKVWVAGVVNPTKPVEAEPIKTLDDAYNTVMAAKDTESNRISNLNEKLGLRAAMSIDTLQMSVAAFVAGLDQYITLSIDMHQNANVQPYFATTSVDKTGNHGKLLRFYDQFTDHVLHYSTPAQVSIQAFAFENIDNDLEVINQNLDHQKRLTDLHVNAVLKSKDRDDAVTYIANIPHAAGTLSHMFRGFGTAIIPATIQGDYYGMAKAFQELSAKFKLIVKPECDVSNALGGFYITPGMTFDVVYLDGRKGCVYLSSQK